MQKEIQLTRSLKDIRQQFLSFIIKENRQILIEDEALAVTGHVASVFNEYRSLKQFIHLADLEKFERFSAFTPGAEPISVGFRLLTVKGNYIQIFYRIVFFAEDHQNDFSQIHTLSKENVNHLLDDQDNVADSEWNKNLINRMNNIIFQTDIDFNWTFLNQSWRRVMGFEIEETIGKSARDYIHPDDVEKNYDLYIQLQKEEREFVTHEVRYMTKTNKTIWMRIYAMLARDASDRIIGCYGTLQNINKEVKNRTLIELLSNTVTDLICIIDLDGVFKYVSASSTHTTGYRPEELLGKSSTDLIHINQDDDIDSALYPDDQEIVSIHRFLNKSGILKWFETSAKTIRDENDLPTGFATSSRVIDNRKKADDAVLASLEKERELNNLKTSFVNLASHEFRTPLACIRSSTELIELISNREKTNPAIVKHANNIYYEIERLTALMDKILTVGKIDAQSLACKKELLDIEVIILQIINNLENTQTPQRKITFKREGDLRQVLVDPLLLTHSITNLISNALKFSEDEAAPIVCLIFNQDGYEIKVRDFGIGIPAGEQQNIFQAFYRAENAIAIQGSGLGMFITKKFIELHNGTLSYKSFPNKGTEFVIKLNSAMDLQNTHSLPHDAALLR